MLLRVIGRSSGTWIYNEGMRPAFQGMRLAADSVVERSIRRSPAPCVAFKSICDSHLADRLLERFAGSRVVWIYRDYRDVANSAVRHWGEHQRDVMRWIVQGDAERLGWRGERLSDESVRLVKDLYRDEMSVEEGASLFWYLRNQFYFDLSLDRDPRALLVRYEHIVEDPGARFPTIFQFMGDVFHRGLAEDVFTSSIRKVSFPEIDSRIREACVGLLARLDEHAWRQAPES